MFDIEKIDNELYMSTCGILRDKDYNEIWSKIKTNPKILREAVKIKRDKFNEKDTVKGITISEAILREYDSVDKIAYNCLINYIYTNSDIARIVINGASNGGFSFLLLSLFNHNLKLNERQKSFAVTEAMNKIGTIHWQEKKQKFIKLLDNYGINEINDDLINVEGCINLLSSNTKLQYMNYLFTMLSDTQAHGVGEYDIRYYILKNPNWSLKEKQKLIMDFWSDDEMYDEFLEQWEWGIINDFANYNGNFASLLDKQKLYEYSYNNLLNIYKDKKTADRIWKEIQFCKLMHKLRPQQWELETSSKKKDLVIY